MNSTPDLFSVSLPVNLEAIHGLIFSYGLSPSERLNRIELCNAANLMKRFVTTTQERKDHQP